MNALTLSGKILYSLPFALFGLGHFTNAGHMAGMVPSFIPGGVFWVYVTGIAMIAAALSIVIGKYTRLSGLLLAALLLIFALTIMLPGMGSDDAQVKQMSFVGLLKDVSLAGAALLIASISGNKNN